MKAKWAAGQATLNAWCSIGSTFTAEIMAAQGYDSITVDLQHGALDYSDLLPMFQAMRASGATLLARATWLEPGIIMKCLDAGAYGVICPMVSTRAQAEEFVSYMRYPPKGQRSFGPTRALFAVGDNYAAEANDELLAFAMIETAEGFENLEEIVATPGLDGIYVGPSDLTFALFQGRLRAGLDREEPEMIAAFRKIVAACRKAGIRCGIQCLAPEYGARAAAWGFDMVTVAGDSRLLAAAAGDSVAAFRRLMSQGAGEAVKGVY